VYRSRGPDAPTLTHNFQGTHILGASRGHLSDRLAWHLVILGSSNLGPTFLSLPIIYQSSTVLSFSFSRSDLHRLQSSTFLVWLRVLD